MVEGTSGNTGVGLAIAAALKGYHCIFTLPDKMSQEKVRLLRAYGAEVVITPTAVPPDHPENYVMKAKQIVHDTPGAILANQFYNPVNPEAHYRTTGPEVWEQTKGKVTHFIAGAGTGGTVSGAGKYLKERNPAIRVIAGDPVGIALHRVPSHPHAGRGSALQGGGHRRRQGRPPPSGGTSSTSSARCPTARRCRWPAGSPGKRASWSEARPGSTW